ncbi:cell division FtsA domain-containing protein [Clostridium sp. BJN0001]|uniref:cell division FtsA domain-containing protein n=1 Tax=Clostridium sp. BJN0001 TaxID=2930219 RepID=UPI001FD2E4B4|nr:cell division FtsA domain-containing protein [Clostridium sp. BJN0001]
MQEEIIAAIDFGSRKISASIGKVSDENDDMDIFAVESCTSLGMKKGIIDDEAKVRESVLSLLLELEKRTNKKVSDVSIGISSRKVRITEINLKTEINESIKKSDIRKLYKKALSYKKSVSENERVIDAIINFYIVDGKVFDKNVLNWKANSLEINFTLAIIDKDVIDKYYNIFENTKFNIKFIKLNIFSAKQIFLNKKNSIGEIVLIDIGAEVSDLAVFNNGIVEFVSSVPAGGSNISKDLSVATNLSYTECDNFKKIYSGNYITLFNDNSVNENINVGTVSISKEIFYKVTNARIEDILNYVNNQLKKTSHYDNICSIILFGNGLSYFEKVGEFSKSILKKNVKVITNKELGLRSSENITSMAVLKDTEELINVIGILKKVSIDNEALNNIKPIDAETLNQDNEKNEEDTILTKVKNFFRKII